MIPQKRLAYIRKCIAEHGETSNNIQYNLNLSKNLDTSLDEQGPGYIECLESVTLARESVLSDEMQTNLLHEDQNGSGHSIPAASAIENVVYSLKNNANVTGIKGVSNTEDLSKGDKSDESDFYSDDSVKDPNFRHRSGSTSSTDSSSSSSTSSSSSSALSTRSSHSENIPPVLDSSNRNIILPTLYSSSSENIPLANPLSQLENLDSNKKLTRKRQRNVNNWKSEVAKRLRNTEQRNIFIKKTKEGHTSQNSRATMWWIAITVAVILISFILMAVKH